MGASAPTPDLSGGTMKVRVLEKIHLAYKAAPDLPGDVIDIPEEKAVLLIRTGQAEAYTKPEPEPVTEKPKRGRGRPKGS